MNNAARWLKISQPVVQELKSVYEMGEFSVMTLSLKAWQ